MVVPPGRDKLYKVRVFKRVSLVLCLEIRVRFSKVPIINGSAKLLLFKCMVEISIAWHLT